MSRTTKEMAQRTVPLACDLKYSATTDGKIIRTDTGKELSLRVNHAGYVLVTLKLNGQALPKLVHTLVLTAFTGGPPEDGQTYSCDHINRERGDNHLINLRWATSTQQASNSSRCLVPGKPRAAQYRPVMVTAGNGEVAVYPTVAAAMAVVAPSRHPTSAAVYKALKAGTVVHGCQWEYAPPPAGVFNEIPSSFIDGRVGYKASDTGYIMTPSGRVYAGTLGSSREYAAINIGKREYRVHRLVAATFLPMINPAMDIVNHKNGVKTDNRVDNLEWTDAAGNAAHAVRMGISPTPAGRAVTQRTKGGVYVTTYPSVSTAASAVCSQACYANIIACCGGRQKTAYGYVWSYDGV